VDQLTFHEGIMKNTVGDKIVSRLQSFVTALKEKSPLETRFSMRQVTLHLEPRVYHAKDVKKIRKLLGISQSLFAKFLGVNVKTVQSWEQDLVEPSGIARRFMDEIALHPALWKMRLQTIMAVKNANQVLA
jgi:putative transcriptional regulator